MFFIPFDEYGFQPQISAEFDIREGVADDKAGLWRDFRKLRFCLFEQPRARFAAGAFPLVVWAKVESVDVRS